MILDIDEAGATAKFLSRIFKVVRFCVRKGAGGKDVEDAELDPLLDRPRRMGAVLESQPRQLDVERDMEIDGEDGLRPEIIPAPDSPALSAKLPSPHVPSEQRPLPESSFDEACHPSRVPVADGAQCYELTLGQ